jgi:hypothetical protein
VLFSIDAEFGKLVQVLLKLLDPPYTPQKLLFDTVGTSTAPQSILLLAVAKK